jgi:predicted O-methyltransferase YrrM
MALLAVGPLHDYLRMYLGLDPLTNEPCDPNATWYFRGDGQLSDGDRAALDALLGRVARPGLRIAEIGSAIGMGSTRLFAEWVARSGGELICIDPWASIFGIDPRELFDRNMERLGLSDVVTTLQMPSVSAARQIDDHSCDLIFIDGDHRYAAISEDIRLWQSKVRPGGIFCGDDCEGRPTEFDHQELQGNKNNDAVHIARAGSNVMTANVHCGVILAVSEAFGDDCEILGAPPSIWSRDM